MSELLTLGQDATNLVKTSSRGMDYFLDRVWDWVDEAQSWHLKPVTYFVCPILNICVCVKWDSQEGMIG